MTRSIFSIVGLVIALAIFLFYTKPAYDTVRTLQSDIAQYDQALENANKLQQLKQRLLSQYNAFDPGQLQRLQRLLPDHVDNVRLVLDLDNLAARHGLALQNVVINNPNDSRADKTVVGAIGANKQPYGSLILKFSTHGSYQSIVTFLEDIERSLRVVDLVALSMTRETLPAGAAVPAATDDSYYRFDITVRTYWLK